MEPLRALARIWDMRNMLTPVIGGLALICACTVAIAQEEATRYADSSAVFSQIAQTSTGAVAQTVMHTPTGDVLAVYIGRTAREMYGKQDQVLIVLSGHGTANVGYPTYDVKPGSVVSIPRNTAFQIVSTSKTPIKAYIIASPHDDPNDKRVLEP